MTQILRFILQIINSSKVISDDIFIYTSYRTGKIANCPCRKQLFYFIIMWVDLASGDFQWLSWRWELADCQSWAGHGREMTLADRKLEFAGAKPSAEASSSRGSQSALPSVCPAAVTRPLARMRRPRGVLPGSFLLHPGPGRAGAVRVSRCRAANKVALRRSAATAPGERAPPARE